MFHLQAEFFDVVNRHGVHDWKSFVERPFTNGTLVGDNASRRIKVNTKSAIIPSKTDISNAMIATNVERRMKKKRQNSIVDENS